MRVMECGSPSSGELSRAPRHSSLTPPYNSEESQFPEKQTALIYFIAVDEKNYRHLFLDS